LMGLPRDVPLLVFGAMGGGKDPRKGYDLLLEALNILKETTPKLEIVVFGQMAPRKPDGINFPIHYTGHLHDDLSINVLNSAGDVFALPSRQDNLPLTCMEALTCGTPVVAFDISGPPSMIEHKKTGYLAKSFDATDFANGIKWVLEHSDDSSLRNSARDYAKKYFHPNMISKEYNKIYNDILLA